MSEPNAFSEPELVTFPLTVEFAMFWEALVGLPTQPPFNVVWIAVVSYRPYVE
jgi:hypothetical protein